MLFPNCSFGMWGLVFSETTLFICWSNDQCHITIHEKNVMQTRYSEAGCFLLNEIRSSHLKLNKCSPSFTEALHTVSVEEMITSQSNLWPRGPQPIKLLGIPGLWKGQLGHQHVILRHTFVISGCATMVPCWHFNGFSNLHAQYSPNPKEYSSICLWSALLTLHSYVLSLFDFRCGESGSCASTHHRQAAWAL